MPHWLLRIIYLIIFGTFLELPAYSQGFSSYTYPVSDCFTYTYKMSLGATNEQTFITETFTTRNGVTYTTGYIAAGGVKKGFVQEIAMDGGIARTTVYSIAGRDLTLTSVRASLNETLLIIGTSQLANGTDIRPYIAELSPAGTVLWSRTINTPGYSGGFISPSSVTGIGFTAYDATTLIVGMLSNTGNLQWLNKTSVLDDGVPISMVSNDNAAWFIAYNGTLAGKRAGAILQVDDNGTMPWKTIYGGTASSEYILHDAEFAFNQVIISGLYSSNGSPYSLFKSGIYTTGQTEFLQTFSFTGVTLSTTSQSDLNPYTGVIAFTPATPSSEVYTLKTILATNPSDLIQWTTKFTVPPAFALTNVERTFDAGYLVSGNFTGSPTTNGYLLKMDSTGLIKDCPGTTFPVSNTYAFLPVNYSTVTPIVTPVTSTGSSTTITATSNTMQVLAECKALTCPDKIPESNCFQSFARRFRSANTCEIGADILVGTGNKLTVVGTQRDNPYGIGEKGFIAEFDNNGKLTSRKKINTSFQRIQQLQDGNLLMTGAGIVAKFSSNLQMLWNKTWDIGGTQSAFYGAVEGSDGSIYMNYVQGSPFLCMAVISVLKLNADGALNWRKNYSFSGRCPFGSVGSITQDNDYLYVVNYAHLETALMKIRKSDGSAVWGKGYETKWAQQTEIGQDITIVGDNLVFHGRASTSTQIKDVVMVVDKNGNTLAKKALNILPSRMLIARNGDFVFTSSDPPSKQIFIRLDSSFNIKYSKAININGSPREIREGDDGSFYQLVGNSYQDVYENDFTLMKIAHDGLVGQCIIDTFNVVIETPDVSEIDLPPTVTNATLSFSSVPYAESGYSLQENYLFCSQASVCNQLDLQAPSSVCGMFPFSVKTVKSAECDAPVEYTVDNPDVKIISKSDTGIILQFLKTGTTKVKARMFSNCIWMEDEVQIAGNTINSRLLNLGRDTILCGTEPIVVNAGKGYFSYQWNNGASDSLVKITSPGKYFVDVTNLCGLKISDTILVHAATAEAFDLGGDRQVCNNEPITLAAPEGFINYSWTSSNSGTKQNTREIKIKPSATMQFFGRAERRPGCFVRDTVNINVIVSSALELGEDKSIYSGDSIILDAGKTFKGYNWNTGATSSSIIVKQSGRYTVNTVSVEGCNVQDTVNVKVLKKPTGFNIPNAFSPNNDGMNDTFKPVLYEGVSNYKFTVFDRWGNVMFNTTSADAAWNGWVNGKPADRGTYVWKCSYTSAGRQQISEKGFVQLVK